MIIVQEPLDLVTLYLIRSVCTTELLNRPIRRPGQLQSDVNSPLFVLDSSIGLDKYQNLMLIRKFGRRIKGSKCKAVGGQIFEKAVNLGPYLERNARRGGLGDDGHVLKNRG